MIATRWGAVSGIAGASTVGCTPTSWPRSATRAGASADQDAGLTHALGGGAIGAELRAAERTADLVEDRVDLRAEVAPAGDRAHPLEELGVDERDLAERPALVPTVGEHRPECAALRRAGMVGCDGARGCGGFPGDDGGLRQLAAVAALLVVSGAAGLVAEDLPRRVEPLHHHVVAGQVGVPAPRKNTIGGL